MHRLESHKWVEVNSRVNYPVIVEKLLRDVKARPEIIQRALYAQRYVYRNTLILRTVRRNFKE